VKHEKLLKILEAAKDATPGPYNADWGNRTLEYRTAKNLRGFLWALGCCHIVPPPPGVYVR